MNKKITTREADLLLEKYYEGLTTVADERLLREFLSQANLPARFNADKDIMRYFATQHQSAKAPVRKGLLISYFRWPGIAAAMLVALFTFNYLMNPGHGNYAYINGEKITDTELVNASALASIHELSSAPDEVAVSAGLLSDDQKLLEKQLSLFTNL